jgi:hypothetical protein
MKRLFFGGLFLPVVMLLAGCGNPHTGVGISPEDPWYAQAAGTPRFVVLDGEQNVALFIDGSEAASGVSAAAVAGTGGGDDVVYFVNDGSKSVVSFLFHEGQDLPWQLGIQQEGQPDITAALTVTSRAEPRRAGLDFSDGQSLVNIRLYGTPYREVSGITEEQDKALGHIHTALNIVESVSRAEELAAELFPVFRDSAVITYILAERSGALTEGAPTAADVRFWGAIWDFFFGGSGPPPPPPPPPQLEVTIKGPDGKQVDPRKVYYLDYGEETYFDFTFTNFGGAGVTANLYDSVRVKYLHHYYPHGSLEGNAIFFDFYQGNGDSLLGKFTQTYRVKVKRNEYLGFVGQGYVQLVIFFGQNTVVNGANTGVLFHEPGKSGPVLNTSVFVLHFNIFPDQPYPWP